MRKFILAVILVIAMLSGTMAFAHQVGLTCTDSPDKASNPTLTYNFYRGTGSGCTGTMTKISNVTSCAYTDTTVAPGTTFSYYVKSLLNGAESTTASNCANAVIPVTPATALTTSVSGKAVTLNWTASADATSYNVYRGAGDPTTNPTLTKIGTASTPTYVDTLASPGTYTYSVTAVANSVESTQVAGVGAVVAPAPPSNTVVIQVN